MSPIGVRTAAIGDGGETWTSTPSPSPAPATFFISTDGDPERNGSGTDVVVDLIGPNGSTVLFSDDNTDEFGSGPPPAESFTFTIATPGTYFVRVIGFDEGKFPSTGTYSIMVEGVRESGVRSAGRGDPDAHRDLYSRGSHGHADGDENRHADENGHAPGRGRGRAGEPNPDVVLPDAPPDGPRSDRLGSRAGAPPLTPRSSGTGSPRSEATISL